MPLNRRVALTALTIVTGLSLIQTPAAKAATLSYEETASGITGNGTGTDYSQLPVSDGFINTFNSAATATLGAPADPGFSFYDDYVFTVANSTVDVGSFLLNESTTFDINDLQMRLYSVIGNGTLPVLGDSPAGLVAGWSSNDINATLSAGSYVLEVRGDVVGSAGGSYGGLIDLQPVPLPAALPLLLSGLGLLGGFARKRLA
jgi:hypothetical protein